jgi:monofunctional biosynthetic peptidoglycan transglycosylase
MTAARTSVGRFLGLLVVCFISLQAAFAVQVAAMAVVDPHSTTFQRSELWRLSTQAASLKWEQQWVERTRISPQLARAVIASEDAGFVDHGGVEWDALQKAWDRNQKAEARFDKVAQRNDRPAGRTEPKVVGGSTITQQLAKNLFLAGERNWARKGQEMLITFALEALLGKQRVLEIYLNSVEWGEGVFGAEAASQRYFRARAASLSASSAARLAVMLPAPKRFEKRPDSPYLRSRAATVEARMGSVSIP